MPASPDRSAGCRTAADVRWLCDLNRRRAGSVTDRRRCWARPSRLSPLRYAAVGFNALLGGPGAPRERQHPADDLQLPVGCVLWFDNQGSSDLDGAFEMCWMSMNA